MNATNDIQYDIFISYAWRDGRQHAENLEQALHKLGYRVWRDERGIDPSASFTSEIEEAIEASKLVVVCMTDDIRRKDGFVRLEVSYALAIGKPILPARFSPVRIIRLIEHTFADFINKAWEIGFRDLLNNIKRYGQGEYIAPQVVNAQQEEDPYYEIAQQILVGAVTFIKKTSVFNETINLTTTSSPEQIIKNKTVNSITRLFQRYDLDVVPQSNFSSLPEAFEEYDGRLLLLGQPGAGKTTSLLSYTRILAANRLEDASEPLPIFALISSWNASPPEPIHEWLSRESGILADELNRMIQSNEVILLLDGLDELGTSQVEEFVNVDENGGEKTHRVSFDPRKRFISKFSSVGNVIISTRLEEYMDVGTQFDTLKGAITLQHLTNQQIEAYLHDVPLLWKVLESDLDLLDLARTPLLLSLIAFGFRDAPESAQQLADLSGIGLRDAIFKTYIARRYTHEQLRLATMGQMPPFTLDQIYDVLGHVAMINASGGRRYYVHSFAYSEIRDNLLDESDFAEKFVSSRSELIDNYDNIIENSIKPFISYMIHLNLLTIFDNDIRFIHLRLRDSLVNVYCTDENLFDISLYVDAYYPPNPAKALCHLPDKEGLARCLELLNPLRPEVIRLSAIRALIIVDDEDAILALSHLLIHDTDVIIRRNIAKIFHNNVTWIVKNADNHQIIENLYDILRHDTDLAVREISIQFLHDNIKWVEAQTDLETLTDTLLHILQYEISLKIRIIVTNILYRVFATIIANDKLYSTTIDTLCSIFTHDSESKIRHNIIQLLFQYPNIRLLPHLEIALMDNDPSVRQQAAFVIGKIRDESLVSMLIQAYQAELDPDVIDAIRNALLMIGTEGALNAVFD